MRILFDLGTPFPLRRFLKNHSVATAAQMGWSKLSNGILLANAEPQFDVLVTTDQSLKYQQNLAGRAVALFILPTANWPALRAHAANIAAAVDSLKPGDYFEFQFP